MSYGYSPLNPYAPFLNEAYGAINLGFMPSKFSYGSAMETATESVEGLVTAATKPVKPKCLLAGVKGPEVTWAANKIISSGVTGHGLTGNETEANNTFREAVEKYQEQKMDLKTKKQGKDGVIGPITWKHMGVDDAQACPDRSSGSGSSGSYKPSGGKKDSSKTDGDTPYLMYAGIGVGALTFLGLTFAIIRKAQKKKKRRAAAPMMNPMRANPLKAADFGAMTYVMSNPKRRK